MFVRLHKWVLRLDTADEPGGPVTWREDGIDRSATATDVIVAACGVVALGTEYGPWVGRHGGAEPTDSCRPGRFCVGSGPSSSRNFA